ALGIALKLTFKGDNQLLFGETYVCITVVVVCVMTQMNYLNKALDLYNTAIVSPVYYVMFTLLTILASIIMFRDVQSAEQVLTESCGFVTIVAGTFLLHATRDLDVTLADLGRLIKEKDSSLGIVVSPAQHGGGGAAGGSLRRGGGQLGLLADDTAPLLLHPVDLEGPGGEGTPHGGRKQLVPKR
ncbi:Magnesium transporter NIPA2, partial [Tetrabaena socialis]